MSKNISSQNKEPTSAQHLDSRQSHVSVEEVMERSLISLFENGKMSYEIFKKIKSERVHFSKMASECYTKNSQNTQQISIQGSFLSPIQVSKNDYLIPLTCSWGRGTNGYVIFRYNPYHGLEYSPLKLDIVSVDISHKVSINKSSIIPARYINFDSHKKEIILKINCHYADGYIASKAVYRFQNRSLILLSYWQDDVNNQKCLNSPHLKQYYP